MTPKQYNFAKQLRLTLIVLWAALLIFGAGAVFTGYEPTLYNYGMALVAVINIVYLTFNKPTPPPANPQI